MTISEKIPSFNLGDITHLITENPEEAFRDVAMFSDRVIPISDVGIDGIDSKILYVWKKKGLLPFYNESSDKRIWWRFSFIEICWLKLLAELRKVGIGMTKLQELTEFFFPENFIEEFLANTDMKLDMIEPELAEKITQMGIVVDGKVPVDENLKILLQNLRISRFSLLIHAVILEKANYALYFDENKSFQVLDIDEIETDSLKGAYQIKDLLNQHTIVFVNIRKIVADMSDMNEFFATKTVIPSIISKSAIDILKKLFEENGVKEVTIRTNKEGRPTVYVTRRMNYKEMSKIIADLKKSGTFSDVIVKTRNGKVKIFELTELIKI